MYNAHRLKLFNQNDQNWCCFKFSKEDSIFSDKSHLHKFMGSTLLNDADDKHSQQNTKPHYTNGH